jgi:hypothetical protein
MRTRSTSLFTAGLLAVATSISSAQEQVYLLGAEATSNDDFGRAVADAGDVNLDGVPDIVVGAPFDTAGGTSSGSIFVYSGKTGDLIWSRAGDFPGDLFGWSVDGVGDVTGDGISDLIVGAPGWDNNNAWSSYSGAAYVVSGGSGLTIASFKLNEMTAQLGYEVCGLGDITGDGVGDFAFSIPYRDWGGLTDNGYVAVYSGAGINFLFSRSGDEDGALYGYSFDVVRATGAQATSRLIVGEPRVDGVGTDRGQARLLDGFGNTMSLFAGSTNNEWLGAAVAGLGDVNNDGWEDYAFSSPYADILGAGTDAGTVKVYSGASTSHLFSITGATAGANMGQSLSRVGDFNNDGHDDILAGAPNDDSVTSDGGEVRLVSGLTGLTLHSWYGGVNDHKGRSVSPAGDLNQDGHADIVFGASDAPFGAGEAYVHLGEVDPPSIYCTAKVNSQGCTPMVATQGTSSLSIADNFVVTASNVLNQKNGLLFWGTASNNVPFKGGTLCVKAPTRRTPVQYSFGNVGPDDCSGSYSFHFSHAYMSSAGISAGDRVHAQFWSRDPTSPFTVGLTDAAAFDVVP